MGHEIGIGNGLSGPSGIDRDRLVAIAPDKIYGLDKYVHWTLLERDELLGILDLLGKRRVTGADIIGHAYIATAEGHGTYQTEPMGFEHLEDTDELLERIADFGMLNEFPNNFKIRLVIAVGESDMVLLDYDSEEQPEICESCEPEHLNPSHSCDHGTDHYSSHYSVSAGPIVDADELSSMIHHF